MLWEQQLQETIFGSATVGLSATGNAYTAALERGCSKEHAKLYAISVGASEAGFQYLLGGIGAFGGVGADDLLVKVAALDNALFRFAGTVAVKGASEAFEENLQNFIDPLLRTMMLGEEYDLPTWEEIAYTSLVSFFTANPLDASEIAAVTSLGIDAYSDADADYTALAERVIANAEKTVTGKTAFQPALASGMLQAERNTEGEPSAHAPLENMEQGELDGMCVSCSPWTRIAHRAKQTLQQTAGRRAKRTDMPTFWRKASFPVCRMMPGVI